MGVVAGKCIYVGDDERDVISGRAVGMQTIVAGWGYLGESRPPTHWGADAIAGTPQDILGFADAKR